MSAGEHFMVVTAETEDADADYQMECGGLTPSCEAWQECLICTADSLDDGEEERHGVHHQMVDGYWAISTGRCVLHALDFGGSAVELLYDDDGHQALATGRHRIDIDECEEGTVYISLDRREGVRL
jgi:hypothetical protein